MAEMDLSFIKDIHAEIAEGSFSMLSDSSVTLDPVTKSYSNGGNLIYYNLVKTYSQGVNNVVILNNGKNSRLSASGSGYLQVELTVKDDRGLQDKHVIMITVS